MQYKETPVPVTLETFPDRSKICMTEGVDISSAATLKSLIVEAIGHGQPLQISLAAIESMDVTGLQLLVAASHACRKAGLDLSLDAPFPEPVSAALREAGLDPVQVLPCAARAMEAVQ
jgi:anti-anti-sigma factor